MFSSRIPSALHPNPLAQLVDARRRAGVPILDLTESNPTRAGFVYPVTEVLSSLAHPAVLDYEPTPRGLPSARFAVAQYYSHSLGTSIHPDQVFLTASTSEAYAFLFKLLANPGERILVPRPSYPLLELLAGLESVHLDAYPLEYDVAWRLDLAALERAVTPSTRAVVIVHPNNPTGSYVHSHELQALLTICRAHDLALISDEVFTDYAYDPDPDRVSTVAGIEDVLVFALSGLSKIVGLPQMKLAWIVVNGPPALRAAAMERLDLVADTYLSVGTPVQHAAASLLALRSCMQSQIMARVRANRTFALEALRAAPEAGCAALHSEGGWYLVLRVPHILSEEAWALELLDRDGVLVHPGYFFDFPREAHLVVSLLVPENVFREGIAKLLARAKSYLSGTNSRRTES